VALASRNVSSLSRFGSRAASTGVLTSRQPYPHQRKVVPRSTATAALPPYSRGCSAAPRNPHQTRPGSTPHDVQGRRVDALGSAADPSALARRIDGGGICDVWDALEVDGAGSRGARRIDHWSLPA
jgi:hypothetical protein